MKKSILLSIIFEFKPSRLHSTGYGAKTKPYGKTAKVSER